MKAVPPQWVVDLELSYRRRNSVLRVARGLADKVGSYQILNEHYQIAFEMAEKPMADIGQVFA